MEFSGVFESISGISGILKKYHEFFRNFSSGQEP
jgi:hypothetical protein